MSRFVRAIFGCGLGLATGAMAAEPSRPAAPTTDQISGWIQDLDRSEFSAREQASKKLAAAGGTAIDALSQAAAGASAEASRRALDVLKGFRDSENEELKAKATAALEKLAHSADARLARRAKQILRPDAELPPMPQVDPLRAFGRRAQFGQIQINAQIGGAGVRTVKLQNVNGVRTIEANEGGRTVRIEEDPAKGIKVEVTETAGGQEKTSKYEAKNLEELKKNHPQAEQFYQKYANPNAGAIRAQLPPGVAGGLFLPPPAAAPRADKRAQSALDEARKALGAALAQLKKPAGEAPSAEDLKRAIAEIESAQRQLDEIQRSLESQ